MDSNIREHKMKELFQLFLQCKDFLKKPKLRYQEEIFVLRKMIVIVLFSFFFSAVGSLGSFFSFPLRLFQIQFLSNGSVPSDLSEALVLDKSEMDRLRRRVQQLQVEKEAEEGRLLQAQRQRSRLIRENKEMTVRLQGETHRHSLRCRSSVRSGNRIH